MPACLSLKPDPAGRAKTAGTRVIAALGLLCISLLCGSLLSGCAPAPLPPEFGRIEGLQTDEIRAGEGAPAQAGDRLRVHYRGFVYDQRAADGRGPKFDESYARGQPFEFVLGAGQVIRGWDEGLLGLKPGGARVLKMAPEFGYGDRGAGGAIAPGASLVFEVERVADSAG